MRTRDRTLWRRLDRLCDWLALKLLFLVAIGLPSSCDTKNANVWCGGVMGPMPTVTVPSEMYGNEEATWVITWTDSTPPYNIDIDMGGGAVPNNVRIAPQTELSTYLTQAAESTGDDPPAG
ncbi:hypothetical protein JW859_03925 [bacterium]|nr:hypothetical protein [bacterium]